MAMLSKDGSWTAMTWRMSRKSDKTASPTWFAVHAKPACCLKHCVLEKGLQVDTARLEVAVEMAGLVTKRGGHKFFGQLPQWTTMREKWS